MADAGRTTGAPQVLLGFLAVVVVVVAVLWLWPQAPAEPPAPPAQQKRAPDPAPSPVQAPVAVPPAKHDRPPAAKMMRYPDGSLFPPLNGVTDPPVLSWPAEVPYSPVVDRFTDPDGLQWYRHADGSSSTVQMMFRKDLGRSEAIGIVRNPTRPVKVDDGKD